MSDAQLQEEEKKLAEEIAEPQQEKAPPTDIVVLNEQRSCADILRLKQKEHIDINPEFQREEVWSNANKTRFIDSLTKEVPIPSMCFGFDYKTDKRIVIDGLQRISTIVKFLSEDDWQLSQLKDIDASLSGKSVGEIKRANPTLFSRVENLTLPITVLRCDFNRDDHMEYIYNIFFRLNTGGLKLNAQEIRNCIYIGDFNKLLSDLRHYHGFTTLLKLTDQSSYRLKWEELVLRFFAFFDSYQAYTGSLASFLNDYMKSNRKLSSEKIEEKKKLFISVVDFINSRKDAFTIPASKAALEALLIGIAKNLLTISSLSTDQLREKTGRFDSEITNSSELMQGTAQKAKVLTRIGKSIEIFG
jgi:uncharacterized protein with ParB-like and HNH nuclease domain